MAERLAREQRGGNQLVVPVWEAHYQDGVVVAIGVRTAKFPGLVDQPGVGDVDVARIRVGDDPGDDPVRLDLLSRQGSKRYSVLRPRDLDDVAPDLA